MMSKQEASDDTYLYQCGVCNSGDCDETSWHYCSQCREYLCLMCTKDHMKLSDLQKHKLTTGSMIKNIQNTTQISSRILMFDKVLNLQVTTTRKIKIKLPDDKFTPTVCGCTFLSNGELLLCDQANRKIKLLDSNLAVKDSLVINGGPCDMSVATGPLYNPEDSNENTAIITIPSETKLQYINLKPNLRTTGCSRILDKRCYGVHVVDKSVYVSCYDGPGKYKGDIRILNLYGNEKKRFDTSVDDVGLFTKPFYITVSGDGNFIYVSDMGTNTLTCLDTTGNVIYQYSDDLEKPRGMIVDTKGNIILCNEGKNSVEVITAAGKRHSILVSSNDHGMKKPNSICFRPCDGTLVIGCGDQDELSVFTLSPI